MKRRASLDFLRGAAAFAVAIPHYLTFNAPFQPFAESVAIAAVEVFFVLSGFVLAPQIVDWVVGKPWRNLGVFLVRRWMRTIPPYVVALIVIALMTGNLLTADFVRYLFYLENLFVSANHADFYPVAWSLAIEEWFYVLFAPALFVVARLLGRRDRRLEAAFAIVVILVVAALRFALAPHDWDLNVRRVTLFRIDSIVWGFLLYLALERFKPLALDDAAGRRRLRALLALFALSIPVELVVAISAVGGDPTAQQAFPYVSAAFGMVCVGVFRQADEAFHGRFVRGASFTLGRISYSVYLFHLIIVMTLKPRIAGAPLVLQLAVYVALILALSTIFWAGFERPILAARPYYTALRRAAAATVTASRGEAGRIRPSLLSIALALAALGAGALARNTFMADKPYAFYGLLVATAGLVLALGERARPASRGALAVTARAFLMFALALPFADALYRNSTGLPLAATIAQPTYSYRAAHANPAAFAVWWFYYLNEWIRGDGIRSKIDAPDPQKKLPFVLVPGSAGRMFDTTIKINNLGFRGPDLARDKGDAFRIFALGESQTFGPTLRDGERPWPELLQDLFDRHASCGRRVEVVNAGTEAYTLEDNLERMHRDVLPLKPDLILSAHGMNGLLALGLRRVPEPDEPGVRPRASALLGHAVLTIERAAHDLRSRGSAEARPALEPMSDAELMKSRYAEAYRKLIALARAGGADIALADSSMAVNETSPREVKDFYGAVFKPIDDIIAANAAHNRLVRLIARDENAPLIDMTDGVDGVWDDDLYLDIVHFTEAGNERVAGLIFRQLVPILAERDGLRCVLR
jgi:peptidoglycan/LPS O-acetylase OafA/YrhL/lysophospholipase L1-like esterase